MRKAGKVIRLLAAIVLTIALQPSMSAESDWTSKVAPLLQPKAASGLGWSRVIVTATDDASLPLLRPMIQFAGGGVGRSLPRIHAQAAYVPNGFLPALASSSAVAHITLDRAVIGAMERTGATVGATAVRQELGLDGSGIGVAIIDSGVTSWHDDLTGSGRGDQRIDRFVDFVGGGQTTYDDYGHGTHVAGIIAGNGFDSGGARTGIAPGARLTVLKVLDGHGAGRISDVIAALDYVVANKDELNIRVVNLSVSTGVYESYNLDPLALAAKSTVEAGIVVVAAAGNMGRDSQGHPLYGGITAPGNAPWVLTVGASSHMGTADRSDDTMAAFSSRGPTAIDNGSKPDLVAPGVGVESLSNPNSAMYTAYAPYLLDGTVPTPYRPYLSLTGTSMATPVVTGTVALMLQANPDLTPNAVKAILQYTSQVYPDYDALTQGAGFLNAKGAVELANFMADPDDSAYPDSSGWSAQFIWGRRIIRGGRLSAEANAFAADVVWGATTTADGEELVWGTLDGTAGTVWAGIAWDAVDVVQVFSASDADTVVWGSSDSDTVVWGSSDGDTVVWGSSCTDPACQPVMWGQRP
jgi:subtilisin family serine protease